jgi:hypothetical protein
MIFYIKLYKHNKIIMIIHFIQTNKLLLILKIYNKNNINKLNESNGLNRSNLKFNSLT